MIGFDLSDEQLEYQKLAREFAEQEIIPRAAQLDRLQEAPFDWEIVKRFARSKLSGLSVPKEYGGLGVTSLTGVVVSEELGAACIGMSAAFGVTQTAASCITLVGTESQKRRYLPLVCGENAALAAIAFTESEAGSDLGSMQTTASRKGDYFLLNGSKCFITNAGIAHFYIVAASADREKKYSAMNAFIVDGDSEGLRLDSIDDKMGLRASRTGSLVFENVKVPVENLLGEENSGYFIFGQLMDMARPQTGATGVGIARTAYETALAYAKKRKQFGHPIFENQAIYSMFADMATAIEAARLLVWKAAWLFDQEQDSTRVSSMCKTFASEMAERVCSQAIQIVGARAYTRQWPLEKLLRDVKALSIYEGANQIQRMLIASSL